MKRSATEFALALALLLPLTSARATPFGCPRDPKPNQITVTVRAHIATQPGHGWCGPYFTAHVRRVDTGTDIGFLDWGLDCGGGYRLSTPVTVDSDVEIECWAAYWPYPESKHVTQRVNLVPGKHVGYVVSFKGTGATKTGPQDPFEVEPLVTIDCDSNCGKCAGCLPGQPTAKLGSLDYTIGLGRTHFGEDGGHLQIFAERPSPALATPAGLLDFSINEGVEVMRTNGGPRQVRSAQGLADIVVINTFKYEIRFYSPDSFGPAGEDGLSPITGPTYRTFTVENPDAVPETYNRLRITDSSQGTAHTSEYQWSESLQQWDLISEGGLRRDSRSSVWDGTHSIRTDTLTTRDADGQILLQGTERWQNFPWGSNLVERVVDPAGAALRATWSYYDQPASAGYSHLKQRTDPSGYWERYEYDAAGRQTKLVAQFRNAPLAAPETDCRVTRQIFTNIVPQTTTIVSLLGQEIARSYFVETNGEYRDIQCQLPGAAWDDPNNVVTVTRPSIYYQGEPDLTRTIRRPDGTLVRSQISEARDAKSQFTLILAGPDRGDGNNIAEGTRTTTTIDRGGHVLSEVSYDYATWWPLASSTAIVTDSFGRATTVASLAGTNTTTYGCCGISASTDEAGVLSTYSYDALGRLSATTRSGITTSNRYDALDRVLDTVRIGSDGTAFRQETVAYDSAGRLSSSTDALGHTTTFLETTDADGQTVRSTTDPAGAARIETRYQDGQLRRVTGSAVHGMRYEYGVELPPGDGETFPRPFTREIRLDAEGADTAEWTATYTDMLGRPYQTVYADGAASRFFYNTKGQLVKQTDPDGVTLLYAYDNYGRLEYTALDLNRNGVMDFDGTDRITRTQRITATRQDGSQRLTVQRAITTVWITNGRTDVRTNDITEISADGLQSWQTQFGIATLTNHLQTAYDPINHRRTITETAADGTQTITQYQNDQLLSTSVLDPQGGVLDSLTYGYDPHGRVASTADARANQTRFAYDAADQLQAVTSPDPGDGTGAQTLSNAFDNVGRQIATVLPDGGTIHYDYHDTGELKKTWGARTYPIQYTYDHAGRLATLTTWKNHAANTGAATTTWQYDPQRGFLTAKLYPDGQGPTFTHTSAGRLLSRRWARGITTTWSYNNAGDLAAVSYSDPTPAVTCTYDRRGRLNSLSDQYDLSDLSYNDADQLLSESHTSGVLTGLVVQTTYDNFLRRASLSAQYSTTPILQHSFAYDSASRLQSVTDGTHSVAYAYAPRSGLISNLTFRTSGAVTLTTTKTYDPLNRLASVQSVSSVSSVVNSFSYLFNRANQRTRATFADGSHWIYQYDSLGQLTNAVKQWADNSTVAGQQFCYAYDDIGNRQSATRGSVPQTRDSVYTANALNQYTQRTVPGAADVIGTADAGAVVTVNNQPATRQGSYFHKQITADNSAGAQYLALKIVGVKPNAGPAGKDVVTEQTGHLFIPQTPELFTYDADGNLIADGRWTYTWDAENRLIGMESRTGILPAQLPPQKLEFAYDHQGRRIRKRVYSWATGHWQLSADTAFLYDGWNLLAELSALNSPLSLVRAYTWGLDLSGTPQGAGGIGGLLALTTYTPQPATHFPTYDASGNLVALVDATTGTPTATYEYGPFGEALRATGPAALINQFQFSTKYHDTATGMQYYGLRYLNTFTGRWLNRDPIEEDGATSLYRFLDNTPVDRVDFIGLVLVAIDGTDSTKWVGEKGANSHILNFYNDYTGPGPKLYLNGPNILGKGVDSAIDAGFKFICAELRRKPNEPVFLVGHSRGGLIAIKVGERLKKGCPCNHGRGEQQVEVMGPIPVRFMGLYDAVSMQLNHWAGPVSDNVQSVANGRRDPGVGSRAGWGNTGSTGGQTRIDELFAGTHSAMGGDPLHGDVPNPGGQGGENKASTDIDIFIRSQAVSAGANLKGWLQVQSPMGGLTPVRLQTAGR